MAYNPLTAGDLVAGKPTKEEIFTTVRSNQEQFASDIISLQGTSKVDIFDIKFHGNIEQYSPAEILTFSPVFKAPTAATVVNFVITLLEPSTSGNINIDLLKSTDNGVNFNTMLTADVQLTGTTKGSVSGAVTFADADYAQNDLLKINVNGVQADQGDFHVSIYGEL